MRLKTLAIAPCALAPPLTVLGFAAAEAAGRAADLRTELEPLFAALNQACEPGHTSIPATFPQLTVTIP